MPDYLGFSPRPHGDGSPIGVLVANLGTPQAPTAAAVRPYLREFLSDPRVIELPRWKWLPILHAFVLTRRPKVSAKLYETIWTPEGSPLLLGTERVAAALERHLEPLVGEPLAFAVGMRYGEPSLAGAMRSLAERGCRRLLVLPLYPHYSATSTASVYDAVFAELSRWRWMPELRTISSFHDDPLLIKALAGSIREVWAHDGEPEKLLFSFHGIPLSYFLAGDPYYCQCQKTARLVAERLELPDERWLVCFQSLFGKEEWLKPYTDRTVIGLGREGLASLDVVCPGFSIDCLETLEEIDGLNRELFTKAGGGRFRYLPALNERPDQIEMLGQLVRRHLSGWITPAAERNGEATRRERALTAERAQRHRERYPSPLVTGAEQ